MTPDSSDPKSDHDKSDDSRKEPKIWTTDDFCYAAWNGTDIDIFRKQLSRLKNPSDINNTSSRGQTILYCAARQGKAEGADISLRNCHNLTPRVEARGDVRTHLCDAASMISQSYFSMS